MLCENLIGKCRQQFRLCSVPQQLVQRSLTVGIKIGVSLNTCPNRVQFLFLPRQFIQFFAIDGCVKQPLGKELVRRLPAFNYSLRMRSTVSLLGNLIFCTSVLESR